MLFLFLSDYDVKTIFRIRLVHNLHTDRKVTHCIIYKYFHLNISISLIDRTKFYTCTVGRFTCPPYVVIPVLLYFSLASHRKR